MNIPTLIKQLNQIGEQERIEAKTSREIGKSILQTVCAFANEPDLGGGFLLLGINKEAGLEDLDYQVVGVKQPEKIMEDLASQCRAIFNKPIQVEMQAQVIDKKVVVGVFVPEFNHGGRPIYFKSQGLPQGAYRRIGSSDVRCADDDLLTLYQNNKIESFDYSVLSDASWADVDLQAIEEYRKIKSKIHSDANELQWTDQELLQSLGCLRSIDSRLVPTIAGVLLFGLKTTLRRLLTDMKIDYIRVPGKQWMSDPDSRYTASVEIRGPLISSIVRAEAAVIDDLPAAFSLPEGSLQRKDIPVIPLKVIREAIVNAVMHRDYRVNEAIQIIRYANRIEIRNPGYSLISQERLGRPGSKTRNTKVAGILHDTRLAEKKGTGIGLMRQKMKEAGLSPPLFESLRDRDLFIATFLFHHFLSDEDIKWLAGFKHLYLSDEQARALVFVREVGAIDNAAYRNLNRVDTLKASVSLRQLRDVDLLLSKNQGTATYYVMGAKFIDSLDKGHQLGGKGHQLGGKGHQLGGKGHQLGDTEPEGEIDADMSSLPKKVQQLLSSLGKKAAPTKIREVVIVLCMEKEMASSELAAYLQRDQKRLVRKFLTPMIEEGLLEYKYPQMPGHPQQVYRVVK